MSEKCLNTDLIRGNPLEPYKGRTSEFYWQLASKGAAEINVPYVAKIREPGSKDILFKTAQLDLEREVKATGWLLEKPRRYCLARPKPVDTPQRQALIKSLTLQHQVSRNNQSAIAGNANANIENYIRLNVPAGLNDYLAVAPKYSKALVFILCPPNSGRKFWEGRCQLYAGLAEKHNNVSMVFFNPDQLGDQLETLLVTCKIEILYQTGITQKLQSITSKADL